MNTPTFWGVVCTLAVLAALLHAGAPVEAAPAQAATPISENCVIDSTIGLLEVYYCEGNFGSDYYVNSFGFMVAVD